MWVRLRAEKPPLAYIPHHFFLLPSPLSVPLSPPPTPISLSKVPPTFWDSPSGTM